MPMPMHYVPITKTIFSFISIHRSVYVTLISYKGWRCIDWHLHKHISFVRVCFYFNLWLLLMSLLVYFLDFSLFISNDSRFEIEYMNRLRNFAGATILNRGTKQVKPFYLEILKHLNHFICNCEIWLLLNLN